MYIQLKTKNKQHWFKLYDNNVEKFLSTCNDLIKLYNQEEFWNKLLKEYARTTTPYPLFHAQIVELQEQTNTFEIVEIKGSKPVSKKIGLSLGLFSSKKPNSLLKLSSLNHNQKE